MQSLQPFLNTAEHAALEAGKLINQHADRIDCIKIQEKGYNDLVTEVDSKAQQLIVDIIQKAYPHHHFLVEEDEHKLSPFQQIKQSSDDFLWIIDPLDGTVNFAHGFPVYAISIALMSHGKLQIGVIYDPVKNELFSAYRGGGAKMNQKRMRVSSCKKLPLALIGTGFPFKYPQYHAAYVKSFAHCLAKTADIRRAGACALDLAYVACGRLDGFWELGLQPWDIAAGLLLIQEAGGMYTNLCDGNNPLDNGHTIAACPAILQDLEKTLDFSKDDFI